MSELSKKDLMEALKYGHVWHVERIKEELVKIISISSSSHLKLQWDDDDQSYFIYENECYLFVEDGCIELRCDRNTFPAPYEVFKHPVNAPTDIQPIFKKFIALIE